MRCYNLTVKNPQSNYFKELEETILHLGFKERPHLIFNVVETSFSRDPSKTNVVGGVVGGGAFLPLEPLAPLEETTFHFFLLGEKLSPLVIFKGKNLWDDWQPTKEEAFSWFVNQWLCKLGQVLRVQWFKNQKLCKLDQVMRGQWFVQKLSQCDPNPPVEISESSSTPVLTPES
ncbi:hypothetical protein PR048_012605 [Dryococelus australis]|uniref:Uncharacterized protein n=1 Tax=Dryococelus australis TaxID=614101 RepID=A0ABQ9HPU3_9NEOP|nr:hypothetical protein PR048_012605 [Dryococelus australis]